MEFYIDSIAIPDSIPRLMCQYGSYEDDAVFLAYLPTLLLVISLCTGGY
jgi:hypothetical protein